MILNYKKFNPLGFHLLRYLQDIAIRSIILYGGSSSGKTFSVAQIILIFTLWEGSNTLVLRKVATSIKDTIWQSFKAAADTLGINSHFKFSDGLKVITCIDNGARIVFKGLDDQEKIKGIESFKRVVMEELNEFEETDHKQIRKRLRGMVGQQIIHMFNPVSEGCWIKKKLFDTQKWHDVSQDLEISGDKLPLELTTVKSIRMNEAKMMLNPRTKEIEEHAPDTVTIQTTYLNNFWVVGSPDGTYGYYDEQCIADFENDRQNDPDYYNIYALAEWGVIRSGSEFFGSFNRGNHTGEVAYDPTLPIHICVDSNVLPYISISYWQVEIDGANYGIRQLAETCAESPNNTVRKAAKLVASRLRGFGVNRVYLHGDASTRAANNIDDEKRSFHDLFIQTLQQEGIEVIDCVSSKNPSVSMSGEFINAIYDGILPGLSITIDEKCIASIEDYLSVQKDVNGGMLKTKVKNKTTMQTYEEHGHLSDCKRYVVVDLLLEQFLFFSNRRKRNLYAKDGAIKYYNPSTKCAYSAEVVYTMPNINGKFVMIHGRLCGKNWHITDVALRETTSTEEIKESLLRVGSAATIVECAESYYPFVRELRKDLKGVRVLKEFPDVDRRIAATSDYVKTNVLFNVSMLAENAEYAEFISNILDYNKDCSCKEANAALSGFSKFVIKSFSNRIPN